MLQELKENTHQKKEKKKKKTIRKTICDQKFKNYRKEPNLELKYTTEMKNHVMTSKDLSRQKKKNQWTEPKGPDRTHGSPWEKGKGADYLRILLLRTSQFHTNPRSSKYDKLRPMPRHKRQMSKTKSWKQQEVTSSISWLLCANLGSQKAMRWKKMST